MDKDPGRSANENLHSCRGDENNQVESEKLPPLVLIAIDIGLDNILANMRHTIKPIIKNPWYDLVRIGKKDHP